MRARESGRAGHSARAMCARAARGNRGATRNSRCLLGRRFAARWIQALCFADLSRRGRGCNDATVFDLAEIWKLAQARWGDREHIAGYVARDNVIIRGFAPDTPVLSVQRSCPASALRFPTECHAFLRKSSRSRKPRDPASRQNNVDALLRNAASAQFIPSPRDMLGVMTIMQAIWIFFGGAVLFAGVRITAALLKRRRRQAPLLRSRRGQRAFDPLSTVYDPRPYRRSNRRRRD